MEDKYGCQNGKKISNSKTISQRNNQFLIFVSQLNKCNPCKEAGFQGQERPIPDDIGHIFQDRMIYNQFYYTESFTEKIIVFLNVNSFLLI